MTGRTIFAGLALLLATASCERLRKLHGRPEVARVEARGPAAVSDAAAALVQASHIVAPGIVEPWGGEIELSPQEPGWIAEVLVAEGQHVTAGQVLAVLDDVTQRRAVELARAELAEAQAVVTRTARGTTAEELEQARAEARASRARADFAMSEAARVARLGTEAAVARADVERTRAEADAQVALAEKSAARLAELERGLRREDRRAVGARLEAARARLALAEARLERRRVVAPIAAQVLFGRPQVGEYVDLGGPPLFVLGDVSRLQVRLEIDEIDAFGVEEGLGCTLHAEDGAVLGEGAVIRLAPRMGRRRLEVESPTARSDVRVREVFVAVPSAAAFVPGRRVWGRLERRERAAAARDVAAQ